MLGIAAILPILLTERSSLHKYQICKALVKRLQSYGKVCHIFPPWLFNIDIVVLSCPGHFLSPNNQKKIIQFISMEATL